jgi:hypothetical protein
MKNFERVDPRPGYDHIGKIVYMTQSGRYVMVRRPRGAPFCLTLKYWAKLPKEVPHAQ